MAMHAFAYRKRFKPKFRILIEDLQVVGNLPTTYLTLKNLFIRFYIYNDQMNACMLTHLRKFMHDISKYVANYNLLSRAAVFPSSSELKLSWSLWPPSPASAASAASRTRSSACTAARAALCRA